MTHSEKQLFAAACYFWLKKTSGQLSDEADFYDSVVAVADASEVTPVSAELLEIRSMVSALLEKSED